MSFDRNVYRWLGMAAQIPSEEKCELPHKATSSDSRHHRGRVRSVTAVRPARDPTSAQLLATHRCAAKAPAGKRTGTGTPRKSRAASTPVSPVKASRRPKSRRRRKSAGDALDRIHRKRWGSTRGALPEAQAAAVPTVAPRGCHRTLARRSASESGGPSLRRCATSASHSQAHADGVDTTTRGGGAAVRCAFVASAHSEHGDRPPNVATAIACSVGRRSSLVHQPEMNVTRSASQPKSGHVRWTSDGRGDLADDVDLRTLYLDYSRLMEPFERVAQQKNRWIRCHSALGSGRRYNRVAGVALQQRVQSGGSSGDADAVARERRDGSVRAASENRCHGDSRGRQRAVATPPGPGSARYAVQPQPHCSPPPRCGNAETLDGGPRPMPRGSTHHAPRNSDQQRTASPNAGAVAARHESNGVPVATGRPAPEHQQLLCAPARQQEHFPTAYGRSVSDGPYGVHHESNRSGVSRGSPAVHAGNGHSHLGLRGHRPYLPSPWGRRDGGPLKRGAVVDATSGAAPAGHAAPRVTGAHHSRVLSDDEDVRRRGNTCGVPHPRRGVVDTPRNLSHAPSTKLVTVPKSPQNMQLISHALQENGLFASCSGLEAQAFAEVMDITSFRAGEALVMRGRLMTTFFIILGGVVVVQETTAKAAPRLLVSGLEGWRPPASHDREPLARTVSATSSPPQGRGGSHGTGAVARWGGRGTSPMRAASPRRSLSHHGSRHKTFVRRGDSFGFEALLHSTVSNVTATAATEVQCATMHRLQYDALAARSWAVGQRAPGRDPLALVESDRS